MNEYSMNLLSCYIELVSKWGLSDKDPLVFRSEKGLIAFASHSIVNIIDPWTKQRIQVLENHASAICEVEHTLGLCIPYLFRENSPNKLLYR